MKRRDRSMSHDDLFKRRRGSSGIDQRIRKPQLDEGLSRDADAPGFAIDRAEQIDGEVDVHPLDLATGPSGLRQIQIGRHIATGIIGRQIGQAIELLFFFAVARVAGPR
jgi:hypothetical protein